MALRPQLGRMLLAIVIILLVVAGCASPQEIARRQAEALFQTQQAALAQTGESLRLTTVAKIMSAIPVTPQLPQGGNNTPRFKRLPVDDSVWNNGFGAHSFARDNWSDYYSQLGGLHNGADFGAEAGTTVYAGLTGDLKGVSGDAKDGGHVVVTVGDYIVTYGHTVRNPDLKDGQVVTPETIIGTIANQGDNDHLHLSIKSGGRYYNPLKFFDAGLINRDDWGGYVKDEDLYSIISYKPLPTSQANFWTDLNVDKLEIEREKRAK